MISAVIRTDLLPRREVPMRYRPTWLICLAMATGMSWASAPAAAQWSRPWQRGDRTGGARPSVFSLASEVPLDELPAGVREKVRAVLDHPTLCSRGQPETFTCQPALYQWFLDHPDRVAMAWRRLGAKVVDMSDRGNGRFGWCDEQGSDIHWDTVFRGPRLRVWHAEGKVRPGALLPLVPIQAVVVLRYTESRDSDGKSTLNHQAELILHTDSRAVALAARMFGASAPRLAEQYVSQMEMFFSSMAWYLDQHPEKAERLLAAKP
jgi:hypothetical protein